MADASTKTNAAKPMKRVEAETSNTSTLLRDKCGRAFVRCQGCNKSVAVALISMHSCSLDAQISVNLGKSSPSCTVVKRTIFTKGSASNKPTRPPTAFVIFMNEFRKNFRAENLFPGCNVKDVPKQGAEKWKSMTEEEKKPYLDKAAELKAEYNKSLESNDANDEKDKEKKTDDAEEKQDDDAVEAKEKEVENK